MSQSWVEACLVCIPVNLKKSQNNQHTRSFTILPCMCSHQVQHNHRIQTSLPPKKPLLSIYIFRWWSHKTSIFIHPIYQVFWGQLHFWPTKNSGQLLLGLPLVFWHRSKPWPILHERHTGDSKIRTIWTDEILMKKCQELQGEKERKQNTAMVTDE